MEEILRCGLAAMGLEADGQTLTSLLRYWTLLEEKNRVMNLTAIRDAEEAARLHFLDCAALLPHLPDRGRVADVGSGAGFPGLVIKLLRPDLEVTLLESLQKKALFLRETAETLGLRGLSVVSARAEEARELRESFDAVAARAVARLDVLGELCLPLVRTGGVFIAMKGPSAAAELAEAAAGLRLLGGDSGRLADYAIPGVPAARALVLVQKLAPTPTGYPRRYAQIKKAPLGD